MARNDLIYRPTEGTCARIAPATLRRLALLQGLRIVIRSDSDPARQVLFSSLMQSHVTVRLAFAVHERLAQGDRGR